MVDSFEIIALRATSKKAISEYYSHNEKIYDAMNTAIRDAIDNVHLQITAVLTVQIRQIIDQINENTATTGFLLDLVISALAGPVIGHLVQGLGKKYVKYFVNKRKRDVKIANALLKERSDFF